MGPSWGGHRRAWSCSQRQPGGAFCNGHYDDDDDDDDNDDDDDDDDDDADDAGTHDDDDDDDGDGEDDDDDDDDDDGYGDLTGDGPLAPLLLLRGISLGFALAARGGVDTVAIAVPSLKLMFAQCAQSWVQGLGFRVGGVGWLWHGHSPEAGKQLRKDWQRGITR